MKNSTKGRLLTAFLIFLVFLLFTILFRRHLREGALASSARYKLQQQRQTKINSAASETKLLPGSLKALFQRAREGKKLPNKSPSLKAVFDRKHNLCNSIKCGSGFFCRNGDCIPSRKPIQPEGIPSRKPIQPYPPSRKPMPPKPPSRKPIQPEGIPSRKPNSILNNWRNSKGPRKIRAPQHYVGGVDVQLQHDQADVQATNDAAQVMGDEVAAQARRDEVAAQARRDEVAAQARRDEVAEEVANKDAVYGVNNRLACENDTKWRHLRKGKGGRKKIDMKRDCDWVAKNPRRCKKKDDKGIKASVACPVVCDSTC